MRWRVSTPHPSSPLRGYAETGGMRAWLPLDDNGQNRISGPSSPHPASGCGYAVATSLPSSPRLRRDKPKLREVGVSGVSGVSGVKGALLSLFILFFISFF